MADVSGESVESDRTASRPIRLRFTTRSLVGAVALLGVTLVVIRVFDKASRVLGWVLVACLVAAFLMPVVNVLARRLPRGLAILIVILGSGVLIGAVAFGGIDDLQQQARRLERGLPAAAAELERSDELGEFAREFGLRDRAQAFVDELPERLQGGRGVGVLQSAAGRGAAFLVTGVLSLFMLIYGPRFVRSAFDQIDDPARRRRVEAAVTGGYARAWRYVALSTVRAVVVGVLTVIACIVADVPAPYLLGVWVAAWSFLPAVGILVGALPVLLLAASVSYATALVLLPAFCALQVVDALVTSRAIERRSLHVGPALTFVFGLIGFELYGVGGLVVAVALLVLLAALADEMAPDDHDEVHRGARRVLRGPAYDTSG